MSHELIDYRYHARELQLDNIWFHNEAIILEESEVLRPQLTALTVLIYTPDFLLPQVLDQYFHTPTQKSEVLQAAIRFQSHASILKLIFEEVANFAGHPAPFDYQLDQNSAFSNLLPNYHLFFDDQPTLQDITKAAAFNASDKFLQEIGTEAMFFNPRRDVANAIMTSTPAQDPQEVIYLLPSRVENVGLKLVFTPGSDFPKRLVYIHSLE